MTAALLMIFGGLSIFSALIGFFAWMDGETGEDAIRLGLGVGFGLPAAFGLFAVAVLLLIEGVGRVAA